MARGWVGLHSAPVPYNACGVESCRLPSSFDTPAAKSARAKSSTGRLGVQPLDAATRDGERCFKGGSANPLLHRTVATRTYQNACNPNAGHVGYELALSVCLSLSPPSTGKALCVSSEPSTSRVPAVSVRGPQSLATAPTAV